MTQSIFSINSHKRLCMRHKIFFVEINKQTKGKNEQQRFEWDNERR